MENQYHIHNTYLKDPLSFGSTRLVQIGRMHCTPGKLIKEHLHFDYYELTIISDGRGTVFSNGIASDVHSGDIYLSFPFETHMISSSTAAPMKYDFFSFMTDNSALCHALDNIAQTTPAGKKRIFRDDKVPYIVGNAIAELRDDAAYKNELLSAAFDQILIYTVRAFSEIPYKAPSDTNDTDALCYRIMNYIDTHIFSIRSLTELSSVTGYNYSYLSSIFKLRTGGTISQYYYEKKMNIAKMLLSENKMKISEIADMLNYSSLYAFSKAFHNRFGVYPQGFMRSLKPRDPS